MKKVTLSPLRIEKRQNSRRSLFGNPDAMTPFQPNENDTERDPGVSFVDMKSSSPFLRVKHLLAVPDYLTPIKVVDNHSEHNGGEISMASRFFKPRESNIIKSKRRSSNIKFSSQARSHNNCACTICHQLQTNPTNESIDELNTSADKILKTEEIILDKEAKRVDEGEFTYILRQLTPPKQGVGSLRLNIPDTVFFIQGEAKCIVLMGKDRSLKFIKQKEKLSLYELRKFFEARFKRNQHSEAGSRDDLNEPLTAVMTAAKSTKKFSYNEIDGPSVVGSLRREESSKSLLKKVSLVMPRSILNNHSEINNEVAIARLNDGSITAYSEPEFEQIITKRKIDPYWRSLHYIQIFAKIKKGIETLRKVVWIYEKEKERPNFEKAKKEIVFLNNDESATEEAFSIENEEKFEEDLRYQSVEEYQLYMIAKIYHYNDIIQGHKIKRMDVEFITDETGTIWLIGIENIYVIKSAVQQKEELAPTLAGTRLQVQNEQMEKALKEYFRTIDRRQAVKFLNETMHQHYKDIKSRTGVELPKNYYKEDITDKIFDKIHGGPSFVLSELIRSGISYHQIRQFITLNCHSLKEYFKYIYDGTEAKVPVSKTCSEDKITWADKKFERAMTITSSSRRSSKKRVSTLRTAKDIVDDYIYEHYPRAGSVPQIRGLAPQFAPKPSEILKTEESASARYSLSVETNEASPASGKMKRRNKGKISFSPILIAQPTRSASVGTILNSAIASALNENETVKIEKFPPRHSSFRHSKPANERPNIENPVPRNISQIRYLKPKDYVGIELTRNAVAFKQLMYKSTLPYMVGKKNEIVTKYLNNEYNFIK